MVSLLTRVHLFTLYEWVQVLMRQATQITVSSRISISRWWLLSSGTIWTCLICWKLSAVHFQKQLAHWAVDVSWSFMHAYLAAHRYGTSELFFYSLDSDPGFSCWSLPKSKTLERPLHKIQEILVKKKWSLISFTDGEEKSWFRLLFRGQHPDYYSWDEFENLNGLVMEESV